MEWIDKMNDALNYIEDHLLEETDYKAIAAQAGCSSYNFQRMFSFITDIPLAEYIRRRRLTLAGTELSDMSKTILDIAVKYGYDSSSSFSRAFRAMHGINPSEARQDGAALKAFPRITFNISIKGDREMTYRIEKKEAFDVFGIEAVCSFSDENAMTPGKLWAESHKNGEYERLFTNSGELPPYVADTLCKIHGVSNYRKTGDNTFVYMLCSFVSADSKTEGYNIAHIPAQTYAIFPSELFDWDADFGKVMDDLQKKFYSEWLPTSIYEQVDGPSFEIYGGTAEKGYIELWYPIRKKQEQI